MPTARELLEQADALMRRNRASTLDDIPVLTDAMPAVAFTAAPAPRIAPTPVDPGPPSVPLLTENIDVIDEDATLGAEAIEGEPSAWLEFEDANPSVIGDAPDSIAIVPPVEMRGTPPDDALLASAEHEEIEFTLPAEEAAPEEVIAEVAPTSVDAPAAEVFDDDVEAMFEADDAATIEAEIRAAIETDAVVATESDAGAADADNAAQAIQEAFAAAPAEAPAAAAEVPAAPDSPAVVALPIPPAAVALPRVDIPPSSVIAAALVAAVPPAPATPVVPVPAPAAPAMVDDDERWVAAAEEIRMQVLQRIDLFTDTGLRDQLTQRLQPIADRASADFVKAINLHVGDLLRTYVAEAIEREIERWRRDH